MAEKIIRLEDVIQDNTNSSKQESSSKVKKKKKNQNIPRGVPKSGRIWKSEKKRFSSVIKTRGYKKANKFEKLQLLKKDINKARDLTRTIVEERKQKIEQKKERRRINLQRAKENSLKSEVVQVIKNTSKLKRMKKKQLRNIEKRDTLNKR